jgi:hypothetical protein
MYGIPIVYKKQQKTLSPKDDIHPYLSNYNCIFVKEARFGLYVANREWAVGMISYRLIGPRR